jgi:transketolase
MRHAAPVEAIVVVEEHTILGGLGGALAEIVAEAGFEPAKRFKRIGIPDTFPHGYGSQASMMTRYEITAERTIAVALDLLAARTARTN